MRVKQKWNLQSLFLEFPSLLLLNIFMDPKFLDQLLKVKDSIKELRTQDAYYALSLMISRIV